MMARRPRRRVLSLVLLAIALLVLGCLIFMRPPSWWQPISSNDPVALSMGENFENACITAVHRVREDRMPWAVRVRDADVNAWLATRLPKWLAHAGMSKLGDVVVNFDEGSIEIGTEIADVPGIAVVEFAPRIEKQQLGIDRSGVSIGRLPLPFGEHFVMAALIGAIRGDDAPAELKIASELLQGRAVGAQFKLADGRVVRLRDVEVHEGELVLEFETDLATKR